MVGSRKDIAKAWSSFLVAFIDSIVQGGGNKADAKSIMKSST